VARLFEQSGSWAAQLTFDHVPERATHAIKHAVLDLLGVAAAGADHELADRLARYLDLAEPGTERGSRLFGRRGRATAEHAALYNAAVGHVLDFDDTSDTLLGHPTVVLLPALLALADTRETTGRELITAYAAGLEVAAHIATQVNVAHYERGWHPTATLGVFGAAAASAKLLGLDAAGIAGALAIASAFPSGLRAHFGTHMKAVQVGEAARGGVTAALLAASGVHGEPGAFEDPQGFGAAYNGEDGFRQEPFDSSPSRRWDLVDPGLAIKQYPCCASAHPAVDAARDLLAEVRDTEIERIRIRLHPRRLRHTDNPHPSTPLEGKFSVQYVVATALRTGSVTLQDFTETALRRPDVVELVKRTHAEPFPPEEYGPDHFAGEVTLELADGTIRRRRVEKARGRGTELALSDEDIARKFTACAEPALGAQTIAEILATITRLETVDDVARITEAMTRELK
jgi:2-methylcitrate dehydratase PrpD